MWNKRVLLLLAAVLALLSTTVSVNAEVGDKYCEQLSQFTQRCIEQTAVDPFYPCTLDGYGEISCTGLTGSAQSSFINSLSNANKVVAQTKGVPSAFFEGTETFQFTDEDGKEQTGVRPKPLFFNLGSGKSVSFFPQREEAYHIGFRTNNFTVTDAINGSCDAGCSVDVDIELTNTQRIVNSTGLIARYDFTDFALDTAGAGNDGTINGADCTVPGIINEGCKFNGVNDFINISDSDIWDFGTGDFTFAAWINTSVLGAIQMIFGRGSLNGVDGNDAWQFRVNADGTITMRNDAGMVATSTGTVTVDTWAYIIGTRSGSTATIYIDAEADGTDTSSGGHINSTKGPLIGSRGGASPSAIFNGTIDEIGVWNRALTGNEINKTFGGGNGNTSWIGTDDLLNNGSIAYWRLDGNANDTRSTHDGFINGSIHKHERFEFDGVDDHIDLADSPLWDFGTGDLTFEAWIKINVTELSQTILSRPRGDPTGNPDTFWWRVHTDNKLRITLNENPSGVTFSSTGTIEKEWTHVAYTKEGSSHTLYINGLADGTLTDSKPMNATRGITIGARASVLFGFSQPFNGSIDEVRIYSRALSSSEISQIVNDTLYKFDNATSRSGVYTSVFHEETVKTNFTNITLSFTNLSTAFLVETRTGSSTTELNNYRICEFVTENLCLIQSHPDLVIQTRITLSTDNHTFSPILTNFTIAAATFSPPLVDATTKMCDDPVKVGTNCIITTPVLNCTSGPTFDIINMSGNLIVTNESLARLNDQVYFLNFTLVGEKNEFVIRLCDDTTREVLVRGGDENMTNIAIAILLSVMVFVLTKFALELDEVKHWPLKLGLFGVVIAMGWGILNAAVAFANDVGSSSAVTTTLEGLYIGYTALGILVYAYIMIRIFVWAITRFRVKDVELSNEEDAKADDKGW